MSNHGQILESLAPVLYGEPDYAALARAILSTQHADIVAAQASTLTPIWESYEALIRQQATGYPVSARKLQRLFIDSSRYLGVAQLQRPIIASTRDNVKQKLNHAVGNKPNEKKKFVDVFSLTTDMVSLSRHEMEAVYRFTFATFSDIAHKKVIAFPILLLDGGVFSASHNAEGRVLLDHLQSIAGIVNHDYNHAVTAARVTPYFNWQSFNLEETPYGRLHNDRNAPVSKTRPHDVTAIYGSPYLSDTGVYGQNSQRYESHLMHAHARVYNQHLHNGPIGTQLLQHIDGYFDALAGLSDRLAASNGKDYADRTAVYYATLVYHRLLFMVPHGHPVMDHVEARINQLNLPADTVMHAYSMGGTPFDRLAGADTRTQCGLDAVAVQDMDIGQMVRLRAHLIAPHYWDFLHYRTSQKPKAAAIGDLSTVYTAAWNDMTPVRARDISRRPGAKDRHLEVKALRKHTISP